MAICYATCGPLVFEDNVISFAPLFQSGPVVTTHAFAALLALTLGLLQLTLAKGGTRHRIVGYSWVGLIGFVALSSFFIHDLRQFGPFSVIHILSVITLHTLFFSIQAVRRGDIAAHQRSMRQLFFYALLGAGAFTLLPGRDMHLVLFGQ